MAIDFNVDAALAKLEALAVQHGPQAVEVATQVTQVDSVGKLIGCGVGIAIAVGGSIGAAKIYGLWRINDAKDYLDQNTFVEVGGMAGMIVLSIASAVVGAISVLSLFDVWMWAGIFQPKLALAHELLAKVAGQ